MVGDPDVNVGTRIWGDMITDFKCFEPSGMPRLAVAGHALEDQELGDLSI